MNVDDATLDHVAKLLAELEEDLGVTRQKSPVPQRTSVVAISPERRADEKRGGKDQRQRNPSSNVVTDVLLQMYNGDLLFSQPHGQFFLYEHKSVGLWSPLTKVEIIGDIRYKLQQLGTDFLPNGFSTNLMNDICAQLQSVVTFDDWYSGSEYLLFTNGVLDINSRELLAFDRDLHFTQQMPYPYDPSATCEEIVKWLKHTQHDS